jgi:hypothetical protein
MPSEIKGVPPDYPIPETAFGGQGAERVFMTGAGGLL